MSAHTSGPWAIERELGATLVVNEETLFEIARVRGQQGNPLHEANALVLAAAADMFDALEAVMRGEVNAVVKIRAALKKAGSDKEGWL